MGTTDLLEKLERVERVVRIYSNETRRKVEEINVDCIPLEKLQRIVTPRPDDPLLYLPRSLSVEQLREINNELGNKIQPDFELYYYELDCIGFYKW